MRLLFAHRGASRELPENTLPAFRRALELGADALELDVRLTRDGHIVVAHDASGLRMAGVDRLVESCSLAEVQSWNVRGRNAIEGTFRVPTFDEVLTDFAGVRLNVDAKTNSFALVDGLVRLVRSRRLCDRVLLTSFDCRNVARMRAVGYEGATGLCRNEAMRAVLVPNALCGRLGPRAAQLPRKAYGITLDARSTINKLHALGLRVDYWVVNEPNVARTLLERGADGIVTDDVAALRPVFEPYRAAASVTSLRS